jgi:hypothetical protein
VGCARLTETGTRHVSETLLCERGIPADVDSGNETHTLAVEGWQERTRGDLM